MNSLKRPTMNQCFRICVVWLAFSSGLITANDWPRFRGLAGSGVASDSDSLPTVWSPSTNLAWKTPLPGPGASSPIIIDGKALVTCYSGYGLDRNDPGEIQNLVRHLVCIDVKTGETLWQKNVKASLPEDPYDKSGVSSHGYASHTPCSDGTNVYCFFGKGGVYAFDLNGDQLWNADAGKESDPPRWGSSSSPLFYQNTVIVTAAAESQSIIGFDQATGAKLWQQEANGLDGMWGTPALVKVNDNRTDLVMLVPKEVWGLDPETGKLRWSVDATSSSQAYTSVISHDSTVFAFSASGSLALGLNGGKEIGDNTDVWRSKVNATYASPVRHQSKLYVVSRGVLSVVDATSGERLKQMRLKGSRVTGNARFGSLDYASPVVVDDRLFYLNASGQMFVFDLSDNAKLLALNEVTNEKELFWGSPAVSDGRLVLRSSRHLYCIADQGETVPPSIATEVRLGVADTKSPRDAAQDYESRRQSGEEATEGRARYNQPGNGKRPDRPQRPVSSERS